LIVLLWLWSGWYSAGVHVGNRGLVYLRGGTILVQVVREARYDAPDFLKHTWYPETAPGAGLHRAERFDIAWGFPSIHRVFSSPVGEWWFIWLPLWLVFLLVAAWPAEHACVRWWCRGRDAAQAPVVPPGGGRGRAASRVLLWMSVAASVVVLAVWLASGWYTLCVNYYGVVVVDIERGCITVLKDLGSRRFFWGTEFWWALRPARGSSLRWTLPHTAQCAQSTCGIWGEINMPLWSLFLVAAVPMLLWVRRGRSHPPGHCAICGYDLTGNVSGVCSECGTATEPNKPRSGDRE
jgi:hypothetical protein